MIIKVNGSEQGSSSGEIVVPEGEGCNNGVIWHSTFNCSFVGIDMPKG